MRDIPIGNRTIGPRHRPFIIAEMSGNHNQSLETALKIVDCAAEAGVAALKIQTYTANTMTLDIDQGEFYINDTNSLWQGMSLYKLYQQAYTPWEWHKPIFDRCRERGIIGFSTPFDETAVDFLETLNVPCYKIASFENVHLPLIRQVASTGKPVIMSTGMATLTELSEAVEAFKDAGGKDLILLKCTSSYPADPSESNISTIPHLKNLFGYQVGLSDHTLGIGAAIAATTLGATLIEKHFTLDRSKGGADAAFSLEPSEMKSLVAETGHAWSALGEIKYGPTEKEKKSLQFRRSLYIAQDVTSGEVLTPENMRIVRPGFGLAPKYYDFLLGKKIVKSANKGTPVTWNLIFD